MPLETTTYYCICILTWKLLFNCASIIISPHLFVRKKWRIIQNELDIPCKSEAAIDSKKLRSQTWACFSRKYYFLDSCAFCVRSSWLFYVYCGGVVQSGKFRQKPCACFLYFDVLNVLWYLRQLQLYFLMTQSLFV